MHPELERLHRDFGWTPDSHLTWDADRHIWVDVNREQSKSVYLDDTWRTMDDLLDESWWYRTRNVIIERALRRANVNGAIWDVGGGTGVVSKFLQSRERQVLGVEPSNAGAVMTAQRGVHSFCATLEQLGLPSESLNAVSMFDVLEHVDDRRSTLREVHRILLPGGAFILTLPALMSLWSQFDIDGGHYLRYNKKLIRRELETQGFVVTRVGYFFVTTVVPLLLLRALPYRLGLRRAVATSETLSASGGLLGRLLARFEISLALRLPIGSSLLVIATKR